MLGHKHAKEVIVAATLGDPPATPEYAAGWMAFFDGKSDKECPYPIGTGDLRTRWMRGYYDNRVETFTRKLDAKIAKARGAGAAVVALAITGAVC